jgi:hypothetical protein
MRCNSLRPCLREGTITSHETTATSRTCSRTGHAARWGRRFRRRTAAAAAHFLDLLVDGVERRLYPHDAAALGQYPLHRLRDVFLDQFIASIDSPPRHLTFDLDAVDDQAHGHQQ